MFVLDLVVVSPSATLSLFKYKNTAVLMFATQDIYKT